MELIVKAVATAMIGGLLVLLLKKNSPDMAMVLGICVAAALLVTALEFFSGIKEFMNVLADTAGLEADVLSPVLKGVGIGIITKFSADLSRDAGQSAIASAVELVGAAAAVVVALPLMKAVFAMISSLI